MRCPCGSAKPACAPTRNVRFARRVAHSPGMSITPRSAREVSDLASMTRFLQLALAFCLLAATGDAFAADQCPELRSRQSDPDVATRIAAVACEEHVRWRRPFIDANGRLAGAVVWEGEGNGLQDGGSPWRQ